MMNTQKEGGQAGGQTQDQLWDITGQVSGESGTSRTAAACLSHLPCPKCSNPTPNFTHSMAKGSLCPMLPHPITSEYYSTKVSVDSLRSPQPEVVLLAAPLHPTVSNLLGARSRTFLARHRNVSISITSPGLPAQAHPSLQFCFY